MKSSTTKEALKARHDADRKKRRDRLDKSLAKARAAANASLLAGQKGSLRHTALASLAAGAARAAAAARQPLADDMQMGAPAHFAPRPVVDQRPGAMMPSRDPAAPTIRAAPTHTIPAPAAAARTSSGAGGMMRQVDPAAPTFGHLQREAPAPTQGPALGPGGLVQSPDPAAPTFGHLQRSRAPVEPTHVHPVGMTHVDPLAPAVYSKK